MIYTLIFIMIFVHQAANSPQRGAPKRYKLVYKPHDLRTINHSYWSYTNLTI